MSDAVTVIRFLGGTGGRPFPYGQGVADALSCPPSAHPQLDELYAVFSCRRLAVEHLYQHIVDPGFWRKSPYLVEEPRGSHDRINATVTMNTFFST